MSTVEEHSEYIEKYLEGVRLFNDEEFFEAHDVLEEIWAETTGEERTFLQGLIQASVSLFHFGNENFGGAKKLYHSTRQRLDPLPSPYMGLDLARFRVDYIRCFEELIANTETYPTSIAIRDELVPRMHWAEEE